MSHRCSISLENFEVALLRSKPEKIGGFIHVYCGWDSDPNRPIGNVRIMGASHPDSWRNDGSIPVPHEVFKKVCEEYLAWYNKEHPE